MRNNQLSIHIQINIPSITFVRYIYIYIYITILCGHIDS